MRRAVVALALAVLLLPIPAAANLDFYVRETTDPRYDANDLVDITDATGFLTIPNTSPYRIIRVVTTKTRAQVIAYLAPGPSGKRRSYYLDPAKMSAGDLALWNANRAIQVPEATAVSWLSRK